MSGSYTIPNVVSQSPRGDRIMDVYSHLLTERIIYLGTAIDSGVGEAVGVGAVLLASGAPGKRLALPHTRIILHQPGTQGQRGAIPDLILQADEAVRIRAELEGVLSRHTAQPVAGLRRDTDHDRVFTADEGRAYGLVDHVITQR